MIFGGRRLYGGLKVADYYYRRSESGGGEDESSVGEFDHVIPGFAVGLQGRGNIRLVVEGNTYFLPDLVGFTLSLGLIFKTTADR